MEHILLEESPLAHMIQLNSWMDSISANLQQMQIMYKLKEEFKEWMTKVVSIVFSIQ